MNKSEFLEQLSSSLRNMPNVEKKDIISEYETHFISGKQDGKSEEEISRKLGNPKTIAKELNVSYAISNADNKRQLQKYDNRTIFCYELKCFKLYMYHYRLFRTTLFITDSSGTYHCHSTINHFTYFINRVRIF